MVSGTTNRLAKHLFAGGSFGNARSPATFFGVFGFPVEVVPFMGWQRTCCAVHGPDITHADGISTGYGDSGARSTS